MYMFGHSMYINNIFFSTVVRARMLALVVCEGVIFREYIHTPSGYFTVILKTIKRAKGAAA